MYLFLLQKYDVDDADSITTASIKLSSPQLEFGLVEPEPIS